MNKLRFHILLFWAIAAAVISGVAGTIHSTLMDYRFHLTPRDASGEIVFVGIDPKSINEVGVWPWRRTVHAELIQKLDAVGASEIVFDVDFSSPSNSQDDSSFAKALEASHGSVVLPTFKQFSAAGSSSLHYNRPLSAFAQHSWAAAVNVIIEPDGRVRRYPIAVAMDGETVPSMASVLAGRTNLEARSFAIDFSIRARTIPTLSYSDVLKAPPGALGHLSGKRVLVGAAAVELGDRFSVPNGRVISGPILQILAAESMLQGRALTTTSHIATLSAVATLSLLMFVLWRLSSVRARVFLLLALAGLAETTALFIQWQYPIIVDTAGFQIAIACYLILTALDEIDIRGLMTRIADRRFNRIAMSLGDAVICTNSQFEITNWNAAAEDIFGYSTAEALGSPLHSLFASGKLDLLSSAPEGALQAKGGYVVEFDARKKKGATFDAEACFSAWDGADGLSYGASVRDITERKREAERLRYLAEFDSITGLHNANFLRKRVSEVLVMAKVESRSTALILVSVEDLQQTNALWGQSVGDRLLQAVGTRLQETIGKVGLVARLGGDEFGILIENTSPAAVSHITGLCTLAFAKPLDLTSRIHHVNLSIGVVMLPADAAEVDDAFGNAHIALYRSKAEASWKPVFYSPRDRAKVEHRIAIEAELVRALMKNEFELHYQPQVSLLNGAIIGAEALIRWNHPNKGLVSPAEFMSIANSSAISTQLSTWILATACRQASLWASIGNPIRIGVNLSPSQFAEGDLARDVENILAETGLPPTLLELEVTEDILLDDAHEASRTIERIKRLGVRLVFDDFGTGFGSLSYLKQFPLSGLKIDRSFVKEIDRSERDVAIVRSTILLAKELKLSVIAEGIESMSAINVLREIGCEEGQGYFFGKPCRATDFESRFFDQTRDLVA